MDATSGEIREPEAELDLAVLAGLADLEGRRFRAPRALIALGTGTGMLPTRLRDPERVPLARVAGTPAIWRETVLHAGLLGTTPVWILEDAPGPPDQGTSEPFGEPPWLRGFPFWFAAAAGAAVMVHVSAGAALPSGHGEEIEPGTLVLASDHLNLSGRTPLIGLGASKLGPLFPDVSRLHHAGLRARALALGARIGVPVREAVVACTLGPALETAAERTWWARAGAGVAVQNLATPLLAAAHAGLGVLAMIAVTDRGDAGNVAEIVARAEQLAPATEDLIERLAPDLARAADELGVDE
jgi:purine-nucleoside phosphorylase